MTRIFLALLSLCSMAALAADPLVVYSSRQEHLIKPLFERYHEQTGTEVAFVIDSAGALIERLAAEGESTPADLLMTVDAGNLWLAKERGLLRPTFSKALLRDVPAHLRDPDSHWYGLSQRARTIVYSTERVAPRSLSSYEALADAQWKGRLCLRTSNKVYNQSLLAMMIERLGERQTEAVVRGWVSNLAAPVFSNDTRLLEAIAAGQCDVGIVNTYYLGRLLKDDPAFPVAVFWPNQDGAGVHVNVAGVAMVKHSDRPAAAQAFMEWLASEAAQEDFAAINLEYPVNPRVSPAPMLQDWGEFRADPINLTVAGERQRQAVRLADRAGYR